MHYKTEKKQQEIQREKIETERSNGVAMKEYQVLAPTVITHYI